MNLSRRGFLAGIIAAGVAPIIVRAGVLMPVKPRLIMADEVYGAQKRALLRSWLEMREMLAANLLNAQFTGTTYARVDYTPDGAPETKYVQLWRMPDQSIASLTEHGDAIALS